MPQGPILIFDKSTLQSLDPDESMWLDNFFLTNITPLFFIETLADLEKEVRSGRTPEQVVGNLAYKTPDLQSRPNVHHSQLLAAELSGAGTISMDGRPIISGGKTVILDGKAGIVHQRTPEEEALERWHRGEFLDLERQTAKAWRRALSNVDYEGKYELFQKWFEGGQKPKTLFDAKLLADANIDRTNQESCLEFGLSLIGIPLAAQTLVLERWRSAGKPPIREFAPYFRHVFSIDFFFYLAIAADLISRVRPSNKVDLAYLYYLPFCMVFTSGDNLHARTAPLFLRGDQTFVKGLDLKADLGKLDEHYSRLPEETKSQGVFHFADCPPTDTSFLVTQLWDKHLPLWRKHKAEPQRAADEGDQKEIVELMNRIQDAADSSDLVTQVSSEDASYLQIQRNVLFRKGKWQRFPPEVEKGRDKNSKGTA